MNNEPRTTMGGKPVFTVPSKSVLNLESGFSHKLLCDGPTFTAGTACVYNCSFCYVPDAMRKQGAWLKDHGVVGDHSDIVIRRENAVETLRAELSKPKARAITQQKLVIYASPLVDVAGNMDLVRETVEMCKVILSSTFWDIRLLSKSNLLPKIAQALTEWDIHDRAKLRVIYGVSTGTLDDKIAAAFEEGCPLVSKRIQSLHWLQDNGYRTFGMICPSLPQHDYDAFSKAMFSALRAEKLEHIWAEVINLRGDSFTKTVDRLSAAGIQFENIMLRIISDRKEVWEKYARDTFVAHARQCQNSPGKLRFLQYVTNDTKKFWKDREGDGAVLLGACA